MVTFVFLSLFNSLLQKKNRNAQLLNDLLKELLRIQSNSYHFHLDRDVCITLSRVIFISPFPFNISWHITDKIYLEHNAWRPRLKGSRKSLTQRYEMQPLPVTLILKCAWHLWLYFFDGDGKKCSWGKL